MSDNIVEVYAHKTKIWIGVALKPGVYIALWGPSVRTDWRPGPLPLGAGFKRVQGELIRGDMYKKAREKERKGYTHLGSFPFDQLISPVDNQSFGPVVQLRGIVQEHAESAGVDLWAGSGAQGTQLKAHPLATLTELIRGGDSAVPWA